ncbi:MAG TPA: hypothetical protein VFW65_38135 [Pseudonocardiaceae bacterium]|nr:hypothetical protein [Pseudonocardiaceae bacterium]
MAGTTTRSTTDWRTGLPARLGAAAIIGALTGGAAQLTGHLMPIGPVAVDCHPAGGIGCAIAVPITGVLLGALRWLLVVAAAALVVGGLLAGLSARLAGVRIGMVTPLAWPVALWAIATLVRPAGVVIHLDGAAMSGYVALAFVLTAVLTAPQIRLAARLLGTGGITVAVIAILALR